MSTDRRRAAARRKAWGRGPIVLRFEPLEGRQLLSTTSLADLVPVALSSDANPSWGGSFHVQGTVANEGTATANSAFIVNIYASPTATLGAGSVLLDQATVPAGLVVGGQAAFDRVVTLPLQPISGVNSSNTVYIQTQINPDNAVTESNTANDTNATQGVGMTIVNVAPAAPSNVTASGLSISPSTINWGQTLQVTAQFTNNSSGNAPATRARVVLTPSIDSLGGPADYTIANISVPSILAGQSTTITQNVTLPSYPPAAHLGSTGFTVSIVPDSDFQTSLTAPRIAVNGNGLDMASLTINTPPTKLSVARPNLSVTSAMAPSAAIELTQPFQVVATLQNSGTADAGPFRVRFILVGSNGNITSGVFLGDTTVSGLSVGATQTVTQTLQLPSNLPSYLTTTNATSQARVAVEIDPEHTMDISDPGKTTQVTGLMNLKLIAADGTASLVPVNATPSPTSTAAKAVGVQRAATASRIVTVTVHGKKHTIVKAPKHTLSHNLKVFPHRVSKFVKDLVKGL